MTTLTFAPIAFQSIEEYKTWRTEWKQQYKQLSVDIRVAKQDLRQKQREHSIAMYGSGGTATQRVAITTAMSALWTSLGALGRLRTTACEALELRQQSKVKAAQLYILEHRVETTTEM
jgi:hypothetical protein